MHASCLRGSSSSSYVLVSPPVSTWSREEVEATVADYWAMLILELQGEPYSKAEHRRQLKRLLRTRNDHAIEFKHFNISAVLIELGYPYIDGYKPRRNYQALLRDVIVERLGATPAVRDAAEAFIEAPIIEAPAMTDILSILVPPPVRERRPSQPRERQFASTPLTSYAERDQRNQSLGRMGEELVMKYERERLYRAGKKRLAEKVEHVSASQGDHLGYDIRSFEEDEAPRLIEVKTTRLAALTPFFATRNEVAISEENSDDYHLYRLYRFSKEPKLFVLSGALRDTCELTPITFLARMA